MVDGINAGIRTLIGTKRQLKLNSNHFFRYSNSLRLQRIAFISPIKISVSKYRFSETFIMGNSFNFLLCIGAMPFAYIETPLCQEKRKGQRFFSSITLKYMVFRKKNLMYFRSIFFVPPLTEDIAATLCLLLPFFLQKKCFENRKKVR